LPASASRPEPAALAKTPALLRDTLKKADKMGIPAKAGIQIFDFTGF
jgi:hypothetical protein